MTSLWPDIDA